MSPREGEISQRNLPLIPRLGLRLEMAAAEPGSSGTPARRPRLSLASPVLPRDLRGSVRLGEPTQTLSSNTKWYPSNGSQISRFKGIFLHRKHA